MHVVGPYLWDPVIHNGTHTHSKVPLNHPCNCCCRSGEGSSQVVSAHGSCSNTMVNRYVSRYAGYRTRNTSCFVADSLATLLQWRGKDLWRNAQHVETLFTCRHRWADLQTHFDCIRGMAERGDSDASESASDYASDKRRKKRLTRRREEQKRRSWKAGGNILSVFDPPPCHQPVLCCAPSSHS